jgi:hypothetical protein
VLNVFVGETAALAVAAVIHFPRCAHMLWLLRLLSSADFAACPFFQETRYTNHNIRTHLGKYITAATAKAAVSPTKTFNT